MKETGRGRGREVPLPTRCQGAGAADAAAGVALDAGWALEARRYSERRPELNLQRGTRGVQAAGALAGLAASTLAALPVERQTCGAL